MRFASIGSGSAGNGLIVEKNNTRLLLDCGFGLKDAVERLSKLSLTPEQINGILVTHEHEDHAGGVFKLARKYGIPVWLTHGTLKMLERFLPSGHDIQLHIIDSHQKFSIQDLSIHPYAVPHDAREPVQFTFEDGAYKLGVLTDTGISTPHIEHMLTACNALVLECNHDLEMLMKGPYTWSLKNRVNSRLGHLDNNTSAALLAKLDNRKLQHLIAAHLSEKNNHPEIVKRVMSATLNCEQEWIGIACQHEGFQWRSLQ